jgi:hypothetical protein
VAKRARSGARNRGFGPAEGRAVSCARQPNEPEQPARIKGGSIRYIGLVAATAARLTALPRLTFHHTAAPVLPARRATARAASTAPSPPVRDAPRLPARRTGPRHGMGRQGPSRSMAAHAPAGEALDSQRALGEAARAELAIGYSR